MLEKFLAYSLSVIEVATTPEMEEDAEKLIRDVKDRSQFLLVCSNNPVQS